MFVNELSLVPAAVDVPTGQDHAKQFVLTIQAATVRGVQRTIRLPENFFALPIAPGYYWQNWLRDNRVEREVRQFFRSLATKVPFLRDEPGVEATWADLDCFWQQKVALGLKAAYVADGLAVSVGSSPEWDTHSIECEVHELVEEDISSRRENIRHASFPRHPELHDSWIQQQIQHTVENGGELWRRFSDFFPTLACCSVVEEQMAYLPVQSLASVMRGLFQLNTYCVSWQSGTFDLTEIGCVVSPESAPTLQMYSAERTFVCPDGQPRVFNWHAKVGQWRIHFYVDSAKPGHLLIGYVGKHLPTAKFH